MHKIRINAKKLHNEATLPTYGSDFAAGADLYVVSDVEIIIKSGETVMLKTGISLEIPEGYGGFIFARSGLAAKKGLAPANKVGVIDSDYRGEIMIPMHNSSKTDAVISSGERVAQIVFLPYAAAEFALCEQLDQTVRGENGFGSSGT